MVEKSLEVKPESISTETRDLINNEKLFLSQKVKYMLLSSKKWMTTPYGVFSPPLEGDRE